MALHHKKPTSYRKTKITLLVGAIAVFSGASANAVSLSSLYDSISRFIAQGFSQENGEAVTDILLVSNSQTAIAPSEISEMMQDTSQTLAATLIAERQAYSMKEVIDGMTVGEPATIDTKTGIANPVIVGAGVSSDLTCEALADKSIALSKDLIRDTETYNAHARLAKLYSYDHAARQTNRANRHIENYCDITEVAQGVCMLSKGGFGSIDSDYGALYSTDVLSNDGVDAAIAYTLNVIDPATTKIKGCDAPVCNTISAVNTSYQALANVSQGAFLGQMTDRMYYEYQGSKAGKELGKSTNITAGSTPASPATPTNPADTTQ